MVKGDIVYDIINHTHSLPFYHTFSTCKNFPRPFSSALEVTEISPFIGRAVEEVPSSAPPAPPWPRWRSQALTRAQAETRRHRPEGEAGERQEAVGKAWPVAGHPGWHRGPGLVADAQQRAAPMCHMLGAAHADQAGKRDLELPGPGVGSPSCHFLVTSGWSLNLLTLRSTSAGPWKGLPQVIH